MTCAHDRRRAGRPQGDWAGGCTAPGAVVSLGGAAVVDGDVDPDGCGHGDVAGGAAGAVVGETSDAGAVGVAPVGPGCVVGSVAVGSGVPVEHGGGTTTAGAVCVGEGAGATRALGAGAVPAPR